MTVELGEQVELWMKIWKWYSIMVVEEKLTVLKWMAVVAGGKSKMSNNEGTYVCRRCTDGSWAVEICWNNSKLRTFFMMDHSCNYGRLQYMCINWESLSSASFSCCWKKNSGYFRRKASSIHLKKKYVFMTSVRIWSTLVLKVLLTWLSFN